MVNWFWRNNEEIVVSNASAHLIWVFFEAESVRISRIAFAGPKIADVAESGSIEINRRTEHKIKDQVGKAKITPGESLGFQSSRKNGIASISVFYLKGNQDDLPNKSNKVTIVENYQIRLGDRVIITKDKILRQKTRAVVKEQQKGIKGQQQKNELDWIDKDGINHKEEYKKLQTYTAIQGDSFWEICVVKHGLTLEKGKLLNPQIENYEEIQPGQIIHI
uniref:LysM domain-containing protein n=1 Tax=Acrobeloides nanus TaxID=290746 RepID=A0A914EFJ7_9BILA